jgi:hypothetical protein
VAALLDGRQPLDAKLPLFRAQITRLGDLGSVGKVEIAKDGDGQGNDPICGMLVRLLSS